MTPKERPLSVGAATPPPPSPAVPLGPRAPDVDEPCIRAPHRIWGERGLLYAEGDEIPLSVARTLGLVENRDAPAHETR